jgi:hypothetical protein
VSTRTIATSSAEGYDMRVWMLAESGSDQIGFVLGVDTMRALAEMGTPLFPDLSVLESDEG